MSVLTARYGILSINQFQHVISYNKYVGAGGGWREEEEEDDDADDVDDDEEEEDELDKNAILL